ncbi:MAG: L,D-transpeptidase family protein [Paracoccaceae bacterium]
MPNAIRHPALRLLAALLLLVAPMAALAQVSPFRQAVAEAAAADAEIAEFYRARDFDGIWTGVTARGRRNALLAAFADAGDHGLPTGRFDPALVETLLRSATDPAAQGRAEVEMSRMFLDYARAVQTGLLVPSRVVSHIEREVPYRSRLGLLQGFADSNPAGFLRSLPPSSTEYARLQQAKMRMEAQLGSGAWGADVPGAVQPGSSGPAVVALRDRLIALGHLNRTATQTYDAQITAAVQRFQQAMGMTPDGTAGAATVAALNVPLERRLSQVLVAMERERWFNRPRGDRHVWVNLTDFQASIVDRGAVTFQTRSVIGHRDDDRQTPEFSDVMEFMVINPSWYVPRSIIVGEYLPLLQRNRNAVSHILVTDRDGNTVPRSSINFGRYTERTFPYAMRQPPSRGNALGLVKFMFPNPHNIYLHDTNAKSLFGREVRTFSHGCIRLNDPFDFAYALLAAQESDPQAFFDQRLNSGNETRVNLDEPVPVHLVYRTAFTSADGTMNWRNDVYERDSRIWAALSAAGVTVRAGSS